jgi:hypothetical protein
MKFLLIIFNIYICFNSLADDNLNFSIGAGRKISNYHLIAEEMCELFNHNNHVCNAVISKGSLNNLEMLINDRIEFGFIQNDHIIDYNNNYAAKGQEILPILNLYKEALTIITSHESEINSFYDLNGATITTMGSSGGARLVLEYLIKYMPNNFKVNFDDNISESEVVNSVCEQKVGAFALMVSHPNIMISEINRECAVKFIEIPYSLINRLKDVKNNGYFKHVIPGNTYDGIYFQALTIGTYNSIAANITEEPKLINKLLSKLEASFKADNSKMILKKLTDDFIEPEENIIHPIAKKYFADRRKK